MKKIYIQKTDKKILKSFRFSNDDIEMLNKISKRENKNQSKIIRELIELKYLSLFDKKTIEINKIMKLIIKGMFEEIEKNNNLKEAREERNEM